MEAKLKSEVELAGEYRQKPTNDIAAEVLDAVKVIRNVAGKSKHLQGPLQKGLRERANAIMAATTVLAGRSETNPAGHQQVLEELRKELEDLRHDNEKLRQEVKLLKEKVERKNSFATENGGGEDCSMQVEEGCAGAETGREPVIPQAPPRLRENRKRRVAYTESGSDGEGEVGIEPPPALEPIPLPHCTSRETKPRKNGGGGGVSERLTSLPPPLPNKTDAFRRTKASDRKESQADPAQEKA